MGAEKHGKIFIIPVFPVSRIKNLSGHEISFITLVHTAAGYQRRACAEGRPQALFFAVRVVADNLVGSFQDRTCGTVVLFQGNYPGIRIVSFKAHNIFNIRPPPAVNPLVRVAYHKQVPVSPGHQVHQHILGVVGILVFINQDVAEPLLIISQNLRVTLEQPDRKKD
ncbi:MAG: hypothetical protein A4E56_02689 [Pelotomaculum sp. PtaU1.Bin065]|nr:MAG: hypothetical protein A4E56_02689 [Pelotomaculum sp. PtaU1.Bin065]